MENLKRGGKRQPNILFVLPDQLGSVWTSTYGNPDVHTPTLDAFAAEGVLFRQAYTNTPLCAPYRGALFTGRYPHQTGLTCNGRRIPQSLWQRRTGPRNLSERIPRSVFR